MFGWMSGVSAEAACKWSSFSPVGGSDGGSWWPSALGVVLPRSSHPPPGGRSRPSPRCILIFEDEIKHPSSLINRQEPLDMAASCKAKHNSLASNKYNIQCIPLLQSFIWLFISNWMIRRKLLHQLCVVRFMSSSVEVIGRLTSWKKIYLQLFWQ